MPCGCGSVTPNPINCNKTATVCKGNHVIIDIGINCTPVINTSPLYGTVVLHDVNTKYYVYTHDGTDNFVDSFSYNCGSQICTVSLTINDSIEENETLISLVASGDCEVGEPTYTWELPACATLASGYTIHDEEIQIIVNDYDPNLSLEDQVCEIKVTICCGNCNTCCKCKYFYWQPPICTGNCEQEICACPYPCTVLNPDTGNCEPSCESNHTYCLQDMATIYYGNYGNCISGQKRNKIGIRTGSTSEIADRVYYATKTGSVNEGVNTSGQIQIGNFLEVTPLISSSFNFNVGSSAYSIIIKAVDDINGREITFEEMNCHPSNSDNYIRGLDGIYVMFEKDTPCGVIRFVCRIQYNQDFTLNVTGVALNDTNIQNLYKCKTCGQMCCGGNTGDNINVTKTCTKIDDSNYLINLYSNNSGGNWILSSFVNIQDNNGCAVVTDYQIFDETIGSIGSIDIDGQMTFNYISSSEISIKISTDGIPAPGGGFVIGYKVGDCKKYYAFQILALENQTPSNHCLGTFVFNDYLLEHNLLSDNPFYFCNTCIGTTTYCASCCENSNCQINATCSVQPVCDNGTCKCILNGVEVEPLPNGCCPECISDINCRPCVNGVLLPLPTCSNGFVLNPLTCECECECSLGRCINLLTGQCEDCPTVECTSIPNQYTCNGVAVDTTCEPCNNCVSGNCVPVTCLPNYIVNPAFNPNLPISVSNSCCIVDPCHIVQSQCNLTTITEPDHDLRLTVGYCDNNTKKVTINYGLDFEPTAVVANMTEIVWEINNTSYIGGNIILTGIIGGQAMDSVTSTPVPGIYFANGSGIIKNGALIIDTSLTQNKHLIITCTYRGRKKWYRLDMNSNSNACTLVECQDFNCTIPVNTNSLKLGGAFMCRQVFRINDSSAEVIEWIIDGVSYILNGGIPVTPFNNYVVYYTNKLIVINCQENPNPCDCANESTCVVDISFVAMIGECEITSCDTTTYPCTCCGGNCCNESEIKFNSTIDTNGYWYVSADIFSTNPNANLPLFTDCQTLTSLSFPNEFDTTRCGNYPYLKDGLPVGIEDNSSPDLALHPVYPNIQGNDNCGCACGFTFFDCELHDFDGNTIVLKNLGENPKVCFQTDIVGNNCVDPNDRCCIGQCLELNTTSTCNTPPYFVSGYFECNYCNFHGVLHDYNLVNNPPPLGVLNNPIVITDCAGNTVNANWVSYNGDPLFGQLHVVNFLLGFNQTPYDGDCNVDFQNHGIDISCGSITVSYTDDNGCQAEDFVINKFCIEEDCDLSFILNPNCNENQLEVIISGGISPYNYSYEYGIFNVPYTNTGTSTSDTIILPLEAGEPFSIKITDSRGCQFEVVNRVILPCPVECEPPVLDVSFECINNMLRFVTVEVISSVGCGETPVATVSISTSTLPAPLVISGPIVIDEFGSGIGSIQVTTNILVSTITSITVSMACGNSGNTDCLTELIFTDIVCESPNNKTCEVLPKSAVTAVIAFDSSTQAISNDYLPTQKQFAINLVNEIFYSNLSRVAFIDFSSKNDSFLNFQTNNTNLINAINGTSVNNGNSDLRCPLFKAVEALTNYSTTNQKFIYLITDVPAVGESQSCASCQLISNCTGFPTYSQSYILPNDITLVIIANNGNMTALNTFSTFNNNEAIVYYANQSFIADTNFANGVFKNSFINSNSTCIDIEDITYPVTCNCINANINYDCVNGQCVENVNGQYVTLLDCQNNCVPCPTCNSGIQVKEFCNAIHLPEFMGCDNAKEYYLFKWHGLTILPESNCDYNSLINYVSPSNSIDITNNIGASLTVEWNATGSTFFNPTGTTDAFLSGGFLKIKRIPTGETIPTQSLLLKGTYYGVTVGFEFKFNVLSETCQLATIIDSVLLTPVNPRLYEVSCTKVLGITSSCPFTFSQLTLGSGCVMPVDYLNYSIFNNIPADCLITATATNEYNGTICYSLANTHQLYACVGGCGCAPCDGVGTFALTIETQTSGNTIYGSSSVLVSCPNELIGLLSTCEPASGSETCPTVNNCGSSPKALPDNYTCSNCATFNCGTACTTQFCGWGYQESAFNLLGYSGNNIQVELLPGVLNGKLCYGINTECGYVCNCKIVEIACEDPEFTAVLNCTSVNNVNFSDKVTVTVTSSCEETMVAYVTLTFNNGTPTQVISSSINISGTEEIEIPNYPISTISSIIVAVNCGECLTEISVPVTCGTEPFGYDCGNCNEEIEGGIFSTATECQTECANCTEPNFRSSLGLCYVATNEGYAYTSLNSSHTSLQVKFLVDITNPNYIGNEHEFDNMYLGYGACISSCTNYVQLGVGVLVGGYMEYTTTNLISLNSFESIYAIFSDSAGTIYSLSDGNYKFVLIEGACTNEVSVTVDCTTPLTLCEIPESPKSETTLSSNRTGVCGTKLTGNNCVSTGCDVTFSKLGEFMSNESSCLLELKYYIQGSSDTLAPLPNQADCAGAINNTLSSIYAKNIIPSNFINLDSSVTEAQLINEINSVFLIWGNTLERVLGKTIVFDRTLDKNEADVYVSLCDFQLMADIVDYEEFDTLFGQYGLTHYNSYGCYNAILVQREVISLKINSNFNWNPFYEWSIDTRPPLNRISLLWCLLHELAKSFGICDISGLYLTSNQLMNPSNIYTKRYYDIFDNMDLLNDTELIKCILYKYGN